METRLGPKAGEIALLKALSKGPRTFGELSKVVNVHTLQRRLSEFKREDMISRAVLPDRSVEYALTPRGHEVALRLLGIERTLAPDLKELMGEWYEAFVQEWEAYWGMRPKLLMEHKGKFAAVCGGRLTAVADTLQGAVKGARRECGRRPMYVGKVGEEFEPAIMRSPRREMA